MVQELVAQEIRSSFASVGYGTDSVKENFLFALTQSNNTEHDALPIAAFWQKPYDQFSSALAVRTYRDDEQRHLSKHIKVLRQDLWLPYLITLAGDTYKCWEALPLNGVAAQQPSQEPLFVCRRGDLERNLQRHKDRVSPEHISQQKHRVRQMALYEASSDPSSFFDWAFEPTRKQLHQYMRKVTRSVAGIQPEVDEEERARWLLRLLAARIALDKGWSTPPNSSRVDGEALLRAARYYPGFDGSPPVVAEELAQEVALKLRLANMRTIDSALLSSIVQASALPSSLLKDWKLYPTPPHIAWAMLKALPIETIPDEQQLAWDGTCGTGSLLVASLERFHNASRPSNDGKFRLHAPRLVAGNDQQLLPSELTRLALDLTLSQPAQWKVTTMPVEQIGIKAIGRRPSVVVGNLPFAGGGRREERAIHILNHYLQLLLPGGLISVVVPQTFLSGSQPRASLLREQLLNDIEILEIWELPPGTFPKGGVGAAVISGRRSKASSTAKMPVLWRFFDRKPSQHQLLDMAESQTEWLGSYDKAIDPPLLRRLEEAINSIPNVPLRHFIPKNNYTEGIIPGRMAREAGDISQERYPGRKPYLPGRSGMGPFYLPGAANIRWLHYSDRLQRDRRDHQGLFDNPKIFVSRHRTGGSSWPLRAAVDCDGIYPSDQFYVFASEPPYTIDILAAIFNSSFVNCWLQLANPGFTTRLEECLEIPVPFDPDRSVLEELDKLSGWLGKGRDRLSENAIYRVDRLIYDLYGISKPLRAQIAAYFRWKGDKRPGFDNVTVEDTEVEWLDPDSVYGPHHAKRLEELSDQQGSPQSVESEHEIEELLQRSERAALLQSAQAQPLYDNGRPNPMALLYLAEADRA